MMVERLSVLSQEECSTVVTSLYDLREHWIERNPYAPFYTLGVASYLDAHRDKAAYYYTTAQQHNPTLQANFAWLYERLAESLAVHLGALVRYHTADGLPGFHIFLSHPAFGRPFACIHCDLQYKLLDWSQTPKPDFGNPISFTLAMALPQSGSGLDMWDLRHEEVLGQPPQEVRAMFKGRQKTHEAYEVGTLLLHSGHIVHRIGVAQDMQPQEARITLQGHGIQCDGVWYLYW